MPQISFAEPQTALGDSGLPLAASEQDSHAASPIGESGCEHEVVSSMKEVSLKEDCPVRAIGNDGRFSVLIPEELPDPFSSRVVVLIAPIARCRLVPKNKAARARVKVRRIGGDP